jgi:hypothetical protein
LYTKNNGSLWILVHDLLVHNLLVHKLLVHKLLVYKIQVHKATSTQSTSMSKEYWENMDRRERISIRLYLDDSLLLNVSRESTTKELWEKLGNLYQSKSLVNKLFLQKKLYHLRMEDGDSVTEHLNAFNTLVIQLGYVNIMLVEE